jgi:hypothetical protein
VEQTAIAVDRFGSGLGTKVTRVAIKRDWRWRVFAKTSNAVASATK